VVLRRRRRVDRVYIVTVDGVTFGPFPTYERATYFAQDCRSVKPYGIEEVPVDTAIVSRVYQTHPDEKGNINATSYEEVFKNDADLKEGKNECFDRVG
jgi:hypothetical protein